MTLTVTVHDDTGEQPDEVMHVADNDYLLVCHGTCYMAGVQAYPKVGTHVITVKGQRARHTVGLVGAP